MSAPLRCLSVKCSHLIRIPQTRHTTGFTRIQGTEIYPWPRKVKDKRHANKYYGFPRLWITGMYRVGYREQKIFPSLEQRLADENHYDAEVARLVNIGISAPYTGKEVEKMKKDHKIKLRDIRRDPKLEAAARHQTLEIPLEEVMSDWQNEIGPEQICGAATHFGIFEDLFGDAYFLPHVPLQVKFPAKDFSTPVYRGNHIAPSDAQNVPDVKFSAPDDTLWTLMLVNPDGHLQDSTAEYMHWWIGNIPNGDVSRGESVVDYMPPIPVRGTGFHRYVLLLFQQNAAMDFSLFRIPQGSHTLSSRTFHMKEFYRDRQDDLLPSGLSFFLTEWDESVTDYFHKNLDMAEPAFEYEHPDYEPDYTQQEKHPSDKPFNLYLDQFRDRKEMAEEMVKKRLKNISPFEPDPPRPKWPQAHKIDNDVPSWKRFEIKKERAGLYRYKLLYNPMANWG